MIGLQLKSTMLVVTRSFRPRVHTKGTGTLGRSTGARREGERGRVRVGPEGAQLTGCFLFRILYAIGSQPDRHITPASLCGVDMAAKSEMAQPYSIRDVIRVEGRSTDSFFLSFLLRVYKVGAARPDFRGSPCENPEMTIRSGSIPFAISSSINSCTRWTESCMSCSASCFGIGGSLGSVTSTMSNLRATTKQAERQLRRREEMCVRSRRSKHGTDQAGISVPSKAVMALFGLTVQAKSCGISLRC